MKNMKSPKLILSLSFNFNTSNRIADVIWNNNDWEEFSEVPDVPLVGDIVDFEYIAQYVLYSKERVGKVFFIQQLLKDYKTTHFEITKRIFQPMQDTEGEYFWNLYVLDIKEVGSESWEARLEGLEELKNSFNVEENKEYEKYSIYHKKELKEARLELDL